MADELLDRGDVGAGVPLMIKDATGHSFDLDVLYGVGVAPVVVPTPAYAAPPVGLIDDTPALVARHLGQAASGCQVGAASPPCSPICPPACWRTVTATACAASILPLVVWDVRRARRQRELGGWQVLQRDRIARRASR